ncbi:MAG TPA: FAD-dependent oxidoreductase [Ilumatobacteraceae bacterium]|jgi:renalase|nr:FAD-dependent oxidoreductase [Ilumatobacteraceae bacterium]
MRVVVVGAGISGLIAARELLALGAEVLVVDKGRSPGGRLATRRIGDATLDHGAQFFTVRTPAFQRTVDDWVERGLVTIWTNGFGNDDGHPRYVATGGMNSLAKDLAVGVEVACSTMAFAVRPGDTRPWQLIIDDGTARDADRVVITAPLPQAFALLVDAGVELDEQLMRTDYDRTIGLLATLDRPPAIEHPGGVQGPGDDVSFVADNVAKGVSASPAVTVHASAAWSEAHWDDDVEQLRSQLLELARPWFEPATVLEAQVKKWRFATPRSVWPEPCWVSADGGIVLAGDAFDGPRVEAAHNSGLAAAHALTRGPRGQSAGAHRADTT